MDEAAPEQLRTILRAAAGGDRQAAAALFPLVYEELRALAGRRMKHLVPGQTLQPTALVHEVYLRVARDGEGGAAVRGFEGKAQFFQVAARAMRDILVERARARCSLKRGGARGGRGGALEDDAVGFQSPFEEVVALDDALRALEAHAPRAAEVVTLRFFAGLVPEQAAEVLGVSSRTVEREWRYARAWLHQEMSRTD